MKKLIINILLALFLMVALLTAFSVYSTPFKWKLFIVQSGSMEPRIKKGSLIMVGPQGEYQPGEMITYRTGLGVDMKAKNASITHRIVEVQKVEDGSLVYITKGDANANNDSSPVTQAQVIGRVLITVPLIGYLLAWAKTQVGLIIMVIIPATLIIYGEISNIKKELKRMLSKKGKNNEK